MSSYLYQEARSNLAYVLREIVEEAKTEDSSSVKDSDETDTIASQDIKGTLSDFDSPKKPSTPKSRKRKKKEDLKDDRHKQNAYVMKLFDRQIDLASFDEATPLYPICRAWMNNEPQEKKRACLEPPTPVEPPDSESAEGLITSMPPADIHWEIIQDGKYTSPRIPSPIPQPNDSLESYIQKPEHSPAAEDLLLDHLERWRATRTKWRNMSRENDKRYASGMKLLEDMANRHMYTSASSE